MDSAGFCSSIPFFVKVSKKQVACKMRRTNSIPIVGVEMKSVVSRGTAAIAAATLFAFNGLNPALGIISAEPCIKGEGPGCESRAADSPVIRELLEKSRANREKNDKATLEKYWQQGYGDYFSYGYNKELRKDEDGKWRLENPEDLFAGVQRRLEDLTKKDKAGT